MSEMEEIYILEEDDLEEGEITDDSDSEIEVTPTVEPKKSLPKRYSLHDKKASNNKHKKVCKHSHHKIKDRNKPSFSNAVYKKHKSSCPLQHQRSTEKQDSMKHVISTNHAVSFNNLHSFTLKSAFKNFTSPPRPVLKSQKPCPESNQDFNDNYPELLLAYKKCRELSCKRKSCDFNKRDELSPSKKATKHSLNDMPSLPKSNKKPSLNEKVSPVKNNAKLSLNDKTAAVTKDTKKTLIENTNVPEPKLVENEQETSPAIEEEANEEDSEDEEELRRIALATCVKKTIARQNANISANNSPSHSLSNQSSVTLVNGNCSSDNHEVVDMDLDDENFVEDVDNNLFVIDNRPVMPSEFNPLIFYGESYLGYSNLPTENCPPPEPEKYSLSSREQSNDEFEEALLRAELIAAMHSKNAIPEPSSCIPNKCLELPNRVECVSPQSQICKPSPINSKEQLNSFELCIKKASVVKLSNSKLAISKNASLSKSRNINATQKRLIITLNNDSSSDESDGAEGQSSESIQDNVPSIDALISNARQKSDIKANETNLNHVSCLSKAQQEEYKKLRNLLAVREPQKEKIAVDHQNLNFLMNKISGAKEKLEKETEFTMNTAKEALDKKNMYIDSKMKCQHLQEQLNAAKLTKAANLKAWKINEAKLVNAKSVVTNTKKLIALLETELNKLLQSDHNSSSPILQ